MKFVATGVKCNIFTKTCVCGFRKNQISNILYGQLFIDEIHISKITRTVQNVCLNSFKHGHGIFKKLLHLKINQIGSLSNAALRPIKTP